MGGKVDVIHAEKLLIWSCLCLISRANPNKHTSTAHDVIIPFTQGTDRKSSEKSIRSDKEENLKDLKGKETVRSS